MRRSSRLPSFFRLATTTCLGCKSARRPSVMAISTTGTMVPRRLKIPIRKLGARGMRARRGHSTTSSTSSTEKQNRSRPARNTQYWRNSSRDGSSSASVTTCDSTSSCSAAGTTGSGCRESSINLISAYQAYDRAKKLFPRERLSHVAIGALLLGPKFVTVSVFRAHHDHGNATVFSMALQLATGLKPIALRHYNVKQDQIRAFPLDHLLQPARIVRRHRL